MNLQVSTTRNGALLACVVCYILLAPSIARADEILPNLLSLDLPFWSSWSVFLGFLLFVIVVEALVLLLVFRMPTLAALGLSAKANLTSTLVGIMLTFHPFEAFGFIIIPFWAMSWSGQRLGWKLRKSAALCAFIFGLLYITLCPTSSVLLTVLQFYGGLFVSFFLSVLFEAFVYAKQMEAPEKGLPMSLATNGVSYAFLFGILFCTHFRSGAFAIHESNYFFNLPRVGPAYAPASHHQYVRQLEELYMWEDSGGHWLSFASGGRSPFLELNKVSAWAKAGDMQNARDLFEMIRQYNPHRDEWDKSTWEEAEKAITETSQTRAIRISDYHITRTVAQ